MNTLIIIGLFVGLAFILAAGLFSVANDLRLRIEYPPMAHPDGDEPTKPNWPTLLARCRRVHRDPEFGDEARLEK
jgi:hypothetical protein